MKTQTCVIAWAHFLYILAVFLVAPAVMHAKFRSADKKCTLARAFFVLFAICIVQFTHWVFLKGECLLSYLEKRSENPWYVMGSDIKKSYVWNIMSDTCWKLIAIPISPDTMRVFVLCIAALSTVYQMCFLYTHRTCLFNLKSKV